MHTFCSSLMKFSSKKVLRQHLLPLKNRQSKTFLVIKVIINHDNFIAIDPMKKFGARFSFSDFH